MKRITPLMLMLLLTSCVNRSKYNDLQAQYEQLLREMQECRENFDDQSREFEEFRVLYQEQIILVKNKFSQIMKIFRDISQYQVDIQFFLNQIDGDRSDLTANQQILAYVKEKNSLINTELTKAEGITAEVEQTLPGPENDRAQSEASQQLIDFLKGALATKRKEYDGLLQRVVKLEGIIQVLMMQIDSSQLDASQRIMQLVEERGRLESDTQRMSVQIMGLNERIRQNLAAIDTLHAIKDSMQHALNDTIRVRDRRINKLLQLLNRRNTAFYVGDDRKGLRRMNIISGKNDNMELASDFPQKVMNEGKQITIMETSELAFQERILRILPARPDNSYRISGNRLFIDNVEAFWGLTGVLIVETDD